MSFWSQASGVGSGLDHMLARPGQVACICDTDVAPDAGARSNSGIVWRLTLGFGLSVLAQALVVATLPVASVTIAPSAASIGWPFALTLLGAAVASFPASLLLDVFGRRAAFALGASLGIAGGMLLILGILHRQFTLLCLGAFWMGLAQGFGLFYRHAAATGAVPRAQAAVTILAGGSLAAVLAPTILGLADRWGGPFVAVAAAGAAALVHLVALPLALSLPHALAVRTQPMQATNFNLRSYGVATLIGACAWFGMAHAMGGAPLMLSMCGATPTAIGGLISLHLLAMYAPAGLASVLLMRIPALILGLAGLVMVMTGAAISIWVPDALGISIGLALAGTGWSLAQSGSLRLLHAEAQASMARLALHDATLLVAAIAGAMLI